MFSHVLAEGVLVVGQEVALAANAFVVHLVDVGGQPFGSGRFVIAQDAQVRLDVRVQMAFQTPIVDAAPRAIRTRVQFLFLLLVAVVVAVVGVTGHRRRTTTRRLLLLLLLRCCCCRRVMVMTRSD